MDTQSILGKEDNTRGYSQLDAHKILQEVYIHKWFDKGYQMTQINQPPSSIITPSSTGHMCHTGVYTWYGNKIYVSQKLRKLIV